MTDWSGIVVPGSSSSTSSLGPTIAEVKELHGLDDVVKLSWNENLFGPLPGVLEAVNAELENIWLYPEQPYIDFRNEVAAPPPGRSRRSVPAHGSLALLGLVASLLLRPGRHVVVPTLTYGLYAQISATRGGSVHRVPMRARDRSRCSRRPLGRSMRASSGSATRTTRPAPRWSRPGGELSSRRCPAAAWRSSTRRTPTSSAGSPRRPRVRRHGGPACDRPAQLLQALWLAGLRLGYALVDESLVPYFDLLESRSTSTPRRCCGCACLRARTRRRARRGADAAPALRWAPAAGLEPLLGDELRARPGRRRRRCVRRSTRRARVLIRAGSDYGLPGYVRVTVGSRSLMERFSAELLEVCASLRGWSRDASSATRWLSSVSES